MTTSTPQARAVGDSMIFDWAEGIEIELDRFHAGHEDISADVYIRSKLVPNPGLLHFGRLNLMTAKTRGDLAKMLADRLNCVSWPDILLQLCTIAVQRYRTGEPAVDLRAVDVNKRERWLLYPYLEYGGPTILYAEGGVGKSVLALWIALQVALGPHNARGEPIAPAAALYLDWETSAEVHAERLRALAAGMHTDMGACPPLFYRRMFASLPASLAAVRREIDTLKAGIVVIDSLAFAGEGAPEESGTAVQLFQAVRSIPVPVLCVHHKRKSMSGVKNENQRDRLFGSVYYLNSARLVWEADSRATPEDNDTRYITLKNVKANNGRLEQSRNLAVTFTNENEHLTTITVKHVDPREMIDAGYGEQLGTREKILAELANGGHTVQELADDLDMERNAVDQALRRLRKSGLATSASRGFWILPAQKID